MKHEIEPDAPTQPIRGTTVSGDGGNRKDVQKARSGLLNCTILLVEDNVKLNELISEVLVSRGYSVLRAGNGLEALECAKCQRNTIDAVVTDIMMPLMDGIELGRKLKNIRPEVPIVYMSGDGDNPESMNDFTANGGRFLQKPFAVTDLMHLIDRITVKAKEASGAP